MQVSVSVRDNAGRSRYEAVLDGDQDGGQVSAQVSAQDGEVVGFTQYVRRPGTIVFTHTEVDPGHEGAGIGSTLARTALDSAREQGLRVVAQCPFIAAYVRRHPEYADLTR